MRIDRSFRCWERKEFGHYQVERPNYLKKKKHYQIMSQLLIGTEKKMARLFFGCTVEVVSTTKVCLKWYEKIPKNIIE